MCFFYFLCIYNEPVKDTIMEQYNLFLGNGMQLSDYYQQKYNDISSSGHPVGARFPEFTKENLIEPDCWFEALALCEYAIDTQEDVAATESFFLKIFRSYDNNASLDLTDEDYAWYWQKIHEIFDKFSSVSTAALMEKGLQYLFARRGYADKKKPLEYLEEASRRGYELADILWGYYLYFGFCGVTDKEKGMALMNSATSKEGIERATAYKGYIAIEEGRQQDALSSIENMEKEGITPSVQPIVDELHGFILDLNGQYEEAVSYYEKVLEQLPLNLTLSRLGIIHYNQQIASADQRKGLDYLEAAFRLGRIDIVRSLFFCLFESEKEWMDKEKALYYLGRSYLYGDGYGTYQLALLHLYHDQYQDMAKGLKYMDDAVELKYIDALINKAYMLYEGSLITQDLPAARTLLEEAVALGSGNAAYRLGAIYEEGMYSEDGEPDYQTALSWYEKAATMGDTNGYEYAGRYYLIGLGCEADKEKAKAYYEKGFALESAYCAVELALMYEEGNGVEENPQKCFEYLKSAEAWEYPYGLFLLGRCYKHSIGTEEDPDKAFEYFKKAADRGNEKALAELAQSYEYAYGVEQDGPLALKYMKASAEKGFPYAEYKTGYYYMYGLEGVAVDYKEALHWLTKASESDYPYAWLELGDFYLYDFDGREEQEKAYAYYEKAARQDCVNEGLGLCLENGWGVEANEGEAFKYYLKAAEDGYIRAMFYTGLAYYFATGVKQNYPEAFRWFNDASNEGHIPSLYYKGKMLLAGDGCMQDLEEGIALLKTATENDEKHAQFDLGNCYLVGKGVEENEDLAMEWFEKAADNGHEEALKITGRRRRRG